MNCALAAAASRSCSASHSLSARSRSSDAEPPAPARTSAYRSPVSGSSSPSLLSRPPPPLSSSLEGISYFVQLLVMFLLPNSEVEAVPSYP